MATVTVTVDTNISPPTFDFDPPDLPIKPGVETILWTKGHGSGDFAFAAIVFSESNPLRNVVVHASQISAEDNNQRKERHEYAVIIRIGEQYFSSASWQSGGGDGPTIRNN